MMMKFPFLFAANYNHYYFILPGVSQIRGAWHWVLGFFVGEGAVGWLLFWVGGLVFFFSFS